MARLQNYSTFMVLHKRKVKKTNKCQFSCFFPPKNSLNTMNRQLSFRVEVLNHMGWYLGHKGLLQPPPPSTHPTHSNFYKGVCMCKGKTNLVIIFVEPFPNAFAFVGLFSLCKVGLFAAFSSQPDFFADNENNLQSLNTRDTHFQDV